MNQSGKNCTFYPVGGLNPVKIEDQFVYPLARDSRGRLYFSGFASVFGMDREGYEFQSISMRIWSGLTTDDQKKLLRAEWEPYGIDSSKNAQPHWQSILISSWLPIQILHMHQYFENFILQCHLPG